MIQLSCLWSLLAYLHEVTFVFAVMGLIVLTDETISSLYSKVIYCIT
jgi:hypothetical protein